MKTLAIVPILVLQFLSPAIAAEGLLVNGDFEQGLTGWGKLWTRTPSGQATLDSEVRHAGRQAVRIQHTGVQDWSFSQEKPIEVAPGQIYELSGWVRLKGEGNCSLSVVLRDGKGEVIDWSFGAATTQESEPWRQLRSRFVVPPGAKAMLPRLTGNRPATVWLDDVVLAGAGTLDALRAKDLPESIKLSQKDLDVTLHTVDGTLTIADRRGPRTWQQRAGSRVILLDAKPSGQTVRLRLLDPATAWELNATVALDDRRPEVTVELSGTGELDKPLAYPPPFATAKGDLLIMPVNEGISYPVDDATLPAMHYVLYGGHGLCMAWYGATDGQQGLMTLVETPDDAAVQVPRIEGRLCLAPQWQAQCGQFGPPRRLRYVLCDQGGYVAMCKRYREHARQTGLLKTLAEKRKENPNVDRLIGAVNVWCWDKDPVAICRELQAAGIGRILWSRGGRPEQLQELNKMGVLTSRYDIYQDVMDPANFPKLRGVHGDWPTEAWPKDIMLQRDGRWQQGWRVKGKDDQWYACGVLCDKQAIAYAQRRIPEELKTHPYACRFIDTTTASPWRECYHPDHPISRSESRQYKMRLLEFVSKDCRLVTGSETGHDAAVPYVHYFEGMLSLGPYRVPDSGRDMQRIWTEVPDKVAKFQTGHYYRLPLWELVYHDCVVAQWYWGDYNNKLPSVWDRRDLINALCGTPPMFMFNRKLWEEDRQRFVRSYQATCPIARATGYAEMLSHRWLTADRTVQQTRFANDVMVTVNFGERPYTLPDGSSVAPLEQRVDGLKE